LRTFVNDAKFSRAETVEAGAARPSVNSARSVTAQTHHGHALASATSSAACWSVFMSSRTLSSRAITSPVAKSSCLRSMAQTGERTRAFGAGNCPVFGHNRDSRISPRGTPARGCRCPVLGIADYSADMAVSTRAHRDVLHRGGPASLTGHCGAGWTYSLPRLAVDTQQPQVGALTSAQAQRDHHVVAAPYPAAGSAIVRRRPHTSPQLGGHRRRRQRSAAGQPRLT
jgi:hypothetical protein